MSHRLVKAVPAAAGAGAVLAVTPFTAQAASATVGRVPEQPRGLRIPAV
ncbi:hypothetical protein [Streptomyces xantholiticus]|nr:hypothetical protein [Streptomyces xantholiticus]